MVIDLAEQCRAHRQRVVHLVNSTSDKSPLCQGLALNDDLQCVPAKHEALASRVSFQVDKPMTEPARELQNASRVFAKFSSHVATSPSSHVPSSMQGPIHNQVLV